MPANIVLGIRLSPNSFQRVTVSGINLDSKVEQLKLEASKVTNLPKNFLELIYCGNILDDDAVIESCGVKPGVMVHVLKKKEKDVPTQARKLTEMDVQELVTAFKTFIKLPGYRSALHRLSRPEVLENIIMATPGLNEDPVAISIIQDPELLVHMEKADTVRRIIELHPALAEAANHIAAAVHEEAASGSSSSQGPNSNPYAWEAFSDEEEMDSSQSSDSQPRGGDSLSRQHSYSTITAAQLAAALASATASPHASTSNISTAAGLPPTSSSSSSSAAAAGAAGGSLITSEMFSQAMQQAIANVGSTPASDVSTPGGESNTDIQAMANRLSRQLQQMHELGLTDDAVNLQALQVTGGDVHAAIDIVFSGALPPDNH